MLDELDVGKKKRLKCNANPLLCVENALDKVFKDTETMMGVSNVISEGASHCFISPKNSVWCLGLLALQSDHQIIHRIYEFYENRQYI